MAITKAARSKIFTLVQEIKKLLVLEVASQLQQFYGIRPDGSMLLVEQLPATEPEILHTARLLRQRIDYIKSNIPSEKNKEVEAIKQLLNEQAFSILNRFATLRMAEERGIIKETIRKEYNSEGFQIFDSITGQGAVAEQYIRYKWYLHSIFDELAIDLPSVFDRFSPYALVFPGERAMRSLLTIINNEAVTMHREEGKQPMNLWQEDETIGWIYQYYNSREEISEMREASDAPRNSRELAVRNQFFTPRYVVQFLTDNSLGRIWYEMTKGKTELNHKCQYLIRRPKEMFLDKGNTRPENADDETDYIEHRQIKDPREILMLDPACGSMHFGLYSFDLFEQIYTEAWDNHPELMLDLRNTITRKQYINQIPEFIIRNNIHGVDIDPRALQIAALSLWLRAQKSFEKLNLEPVERPQITKSNLVLAEAMPGNLELLSALVKPLDAPLRKLVTAIWDLMKMAGETGLLLRIEEEIDRNINEIAADLSKDAKDSQLELGADERTMKAAERAAFYSTKKYRDSFLENAASEVFRILKELSETATNGEAYQKLLFADDAARGFAFIELCRKKYDVVLMNPPFGATSINSKQYLEYSYPDCKGDIFPMFVNRMLELTNSKGRVGAISNRTAFFITSFTKWRENTFTKNSLKIFADFGSGVLDALVETCCYVIESSNSYDQKSCFFNLLSQENKDIWLSKKVKQFEFLDLSINNFRKLPNFSFSHWVPQVELNLFNSNPPFLSSNERQASSGLTSGDDFRFFRTWWEVNNIYWNGLAKGGEYSPLVGDFKLRVNWKNNGAEIKSFKTSFVRSESKYFSPGITWGRRTSSRMSSKVLPCDFIFADKGPAAFVEDIFKWLCVFESSVFKNLVEVQLGAGDSAARSYEVGIINSTPVCEEIPEKLSESLRIVIKDIIQLLSFKENSLFFCGEIAHSLGKNYLSRTKELVQNITENFSQVDNAIKQSYKIDQIGYLVNDFSGFGKWYLEEKNIANGILSYLFGLKVNRYKIMQYDLQLTNIVNDYLDENVMPKIPEIIKSDEKIELIEMDLKNQDSFNNLFQRHLELVYSESSTEVCDLIYKFYANNYFKYFSNPNAFFSYHLELFNNSSRLAPIYWPISTKSGDYTIWLYYPTLTDQTLVAVINNYLQPKIDQVNSQIKTYSNNSNIDNNGLKALNALREFEHELEEMKKELLRITALPYKPNHDDGVLITAAPLHNLFRHTKWRKSTEDCWKALEKGEYDWAHLAYSIWPDRVTKKCKKDLSMAIAHGLENICEVKPKEKKAKATKPAKKGSVNPQLNFEK